MKVELQRSRTLSSAETSTSTLPELRRCHNASTKPHPFECGDRQRAGQAVPVNGMLQRSRTLSSAETRVPLALDLAHGNASTKPHPFECGDTEQVDNAQLAMEQLQRSRTLSSAETTHNFPSLLWLPSASTKPHPFECGDLPPAPHWWALGAGFNEAAPFRVRRLEDHPLTPPHSAQLQRSRTLSSAETCRGAGGEGNNKPCFNEAAPFRVRRPAPDRLLPLAPWRASTKPHPFECGD